jgi:TRAP transporter 4TM/12TM fusion protein
MVGGFDHRGSLMTKPEYVYKEVEAEIEVDMKKIRRGFLMAVTVFSIAMSLFHLYSGAMGSLTAMYQRAIHLGFALCLVFLVRPVMPKNPASKLGFAIDLLLAALAWVPNVYILLFYEEIAMTRMGFPDPLDVVMGSLLLLMVLEAVRRTPAKAIGYVGIVFLLYGLFGDHLSGNLGHRPYDFDRLIHQIYLTTDGIYGVVLGASADFIFLFILFPAFLRATTIGDVISDAASALVGHIRGGPAKVSVVSSSIFGMISGSGAANVAADGAITIPLMVKTGYRPHFAAAVEATASTGGQIMPPVMGAAAFIMAEILQISYGEICLAAAVPAVLFYIALFFMVDFQALKTGLKGLPRETLPSVKKVFKEGWFLFTPLILLFFLLTVMDWSAQKAAMSVILFTIAISFVTKRTRLTWKKGIGAMDASVDVAALCAAAGLIVAVITLTGVGLKLSTVLTDLAGSSLPLLLAMTMVASIILGMGLPPVACYVLLAVLIAPAVVAFGVEPLAAHLFVFYYGMLALVTPPVAAGAYIAAGIIGADPWKTGWTAFRLSFAGFLIPYIFVYNPELLLIGETGTIILALITAVIGINALAAALEGQYYWGPLNMVERAVLVVAALLLIIPGWITDLTGLSLFVLIVGNQYRLSRSQAQPVKVEAVSKAD